MLLSQAIQSFIQYLQLIDRSPRTINGYTLELRYFTTFISAKHPAPIRVSAITLADLEGYLLDQKSRGLSTATRNRSVYILRSFYSYCVKKDLVPKNLADLIEPVKIKSTERVTITEDEFERLTAAIRQPVVRTVVQTLFYTGGRASEILNLECEDVDLPGRLIYIIAGKGNKDRVIPICAPLFDILTHYLAEIRKSNSTRFFAIERSGQVSGGYVNHLLRQASIEIGLDKPISAHVLRHSFSSILLAKGASLVSIQKLLGHANLTVTSRYLHTDKEELTRTVNLFSDDPTTVNEANATPPSPLVDGDSDFITALMAFLDEYRSRNKKQL